MGSMNAISSAFYDPSISRSLVPIQPATQVDDPARRAIPSQPPQAVIPIGELRSSLESRAGLYSQQAIADDGINNRNRQAIRAYSMLDEIEEREQVSRLLGVDEYA
jgi:hypothetical protein